MIVVDSNVLAYLYLPGEYTPRAEALPDMDEDVLCELGGVLPRAAHAETQREYAPGMRPV